MSMFRNRVQMPVEDAVDAGGGGATDLGDVITASLEGVDRGGDEGGEGLTPPPAKDALPDDEEKELAALENEIRTKNPAMRGSMNIHRHQAVLTRTRNQHEKASKDWAAKETAWQREKSKYEADLKDWTDNYGWSKDEEIQAALQAIALAEQDHEKFAKALLTDPRYAEILTFKNEQAKVAGGGSGRPGPNKKSEDGKLEYYDDDGLGQLLDWHAKQTEDRVTKGLESKYNKLFDERFGQLQPVVEEFQLRNLWDNAVKEQGAVLENARTNWPGFKEQEPALKKYMIDNPKADLNGAYLEVVVKGLQKSEGDREAAWRAKYQKELEAKRGAVGGDLKPGKSGVERVARGEDEKRDMGDVIREAIAKAK